MSLHVAVCIVGFRNPHDIAGCLEALARSTHRDFEVVICENGGPAAYRALTEAMPEQLSSGQPVRILLAPGNLGYAGGLNVCIENSREADAWWILNPDALPDAGAMAALAAKLEEGSCDMVGGVMYHADGTVESFGGRWRPWLARAESIGHGRELGEPVADWGDGGSPSYIPGGNMFFGRRFLDVVGPMREDYFLYCEEVEWCLRGLQKGMRLGLAPGARVLHNQGATTGSGEAPARRPKLPIYLDERNKLLVTRDRFSGRLPVSAAASLMLIFLRYGRRAAWRQLGYALQGWSAGIAGKRGVPGWLNVG